MIRVSVYQGKKKMYGRMFEDVLVAAGYISGTLEVIGTVEDLRQAELVLISEICSKVRELFDDGSQEIRFKAAKDSEFTVMAYNTDFIYQDPEI